MEEEFKFSDERVTPSFQSAAKIAAANIDTGRKRKFFMVIGLLIALFCLYKLYGLFSATPSTPDKSAAKVASIAATPAPAKKPTTPDAVPYATPEYAAQAAAPLPATTTPVTTAPTATPTATNSDQLTTLGQAADSNRLAIQDLQAQVSGLTSGMTAVQNDLSTLKTQLQTLQTGITAAKEQAEKKVVKQREHVVKKVAPPLVTYYVKAMIQGRAWLMTSEGNTFTISEGDTLPSYGTVDAIEPDNGVVMTSSGRVITFKPEDR